MHGCLHLFLLQAPMFHRHKILTYGGASLSQVISWEDCLEADFRQDGSAAKTWRGGGWVGGITGRKRLEADCCLCCGIVWADCGPACHGALLGLL